MKEFNVRIPEESFAVYEMEREGLPGIVVVNVGLRNFEPKEVFGWHLSLIMQMEDLVEKGMPSTVEREVIDAFGEALDARIKSVGADRPNALFLGRITWNGTRQIVWRVFDPEVANATLQEMIAAKEYPRQLNFQMEYDATWEHALWFLEGGDEEVLDN